MQSDDDRAQGPVAMKIVLTPQMEIVAFLPKFLFGMKEIALDGTDRLGEIILVWTQLSPQKLAAPFQRHAQQSMFALERLDGRQAGFGEVHELGNVVGSPGLDGRTQGGFPHAAEGLAQGDGPCGAPVDIEIAGPDFFLPHGVLPDVEAFQP